MTKQKIEYLNLKLFLGSVSLAAGLLASTFALFNWSELIKPHYILGYYAGYVFAFGGFGSMIFGAMLINDFLVLRKLVTRKPLKHSIRKPKIDFLVNLEKEEEKVAAAQ